MKTRTLSRFAVFVLCMFSLCLGASAQDMTKKAFEKRNGIQKRVISSSLPAGYSRIGTTDLYWKETSNNYWDSYHNVDVIGKYNNQYYGSTYSDLGYSVAIKVGSNSAQRISTPTTGTTISGVKLVSQIEAMGTLCRMVYRLTNTTSSNVTISLGVHGDVMIGNVDKAPITRRTDTEGNTYGLTMADGNGAKFCVLFGKGLSGVTSVDDFWFGTWSLNHDASQIVGNYSSGGNYGGIGTATLYYTTAGQTNYSTTQPTMPGSYDIYIEVDENDIYNPLDKTKVGSFTINPALDDNTLVMDANDDNTDILDNNTGENKDVTINNLTIKSNKWVTLCLPFNLTSDQIEAVFGEDADLEELVSSSYDGDINELSLLFTPRTEVVAGMPYAIKVPTEVVNPTFVDVTIANTDPTTIYTTYASMTGSYSPTLLVGGDKNTLFISNNMFYYPSVSGSLAGTKCWFNLLGEAQQAPARPRLMSVRMNMKDNNTTAIMKVTASGREFSDAVYNLQGVRVSNPTKGIYIRNGVKMIVK